MFILFLCLGSYTLSGLEFGSLELIFRYDRWITLASLVYFGGLCVLGVWKEKFFWFLLPFVIMTVPNAINSVLPGIMLAPSGSRGNASAAFFSHIDVYLILFFLRTALAGKFSDHYIRANSLLIWAAGLAALTLLLKTLTELIVGNDPIYVLNGAFQFRYLILLLLISQSLMLIKHEKALIHGLVLAVPFLIIEAFVSTRVSGANLFGEFMSGNFASNVFGNFLAFLGILFLGFYKLKYIDRRILLPIMAVLFVALVATGVRGAILSFVVGLFVLRFIGGLGKASFSAFICLLALFILAISLNENVWFAFVAMFEVINYFFLIAETGYFPTELRINATNSSMVTRFVLWIGTCDMFLQNWLLGVGTGSYNFLKEAHGIPFKVLLDPHNDYLNLLVSFGLPTGMLYLTSLYFLPILSTFSTKSVFAFNPYFIAVSCLAISSLTNANTSKHQVAAIVIIVVILGNQLRLRNRKLD